VNARYPGLPHSTTSLRIGSFGQQWCDTSLRLRDSGRLNTITFILYFCCMNITLIIRPYVLYAVSAGAGRSTAPCDDGWDSSQLRLSWEQRPYIAVRTFSFFLLCICSPGVRHGWFRPRPVRRMRFLRFLFVVTCLLISDWYRRVRNDWVIDRTMCDGWDYYRFRLPWGLCPYFWCLSVFLLLCFHVGWEDPHGST
jgi:hypothetical protein